MSVIGRIRLVAIIVGSSFLFHALDVQAQCQLARLTADDRSAGDEFGFTVAMTKDYAIIGAPKSDDSAENTGSAYVFRREGLIWVQRTELVSPDPNLNDFFGISVAIHGDYAVVAAALDDQAGPNAGALYVYQRNVGSWNFQMKLMASDAAEDDELGTSLAIYGNYIVAGSRNDDAGFSSGSVYVFFRSGSTWSQQQKLTALDAAAGDEFGASVSIHGDSIAIGAPLDNVAAADTGSVYVFIRNGTVWSQQIRLVANDGVLGNELGRAVAIEGDYVIAGAHLADTGDFNNAGAAYVFKRTGTNWAQLGRITANDLDDDDQFGQSVAMGGDYAVIGSYHDNDGGANSGSAYVFRRNGASWVQDSKIKAFDDDPGDEFGFAVGAGGGFAVIGAPHNDDVGQSTGSAYIFGVALDCNGNGDPDACDIELGISNDGNGDGVPDECGSVGGDFDFDNDADVDFADSRRFQNCFNRGGGLLAGCNVFDGEPDGDVDLDDYLMFEAVFDGP